MFNIFIPTQTHNPPVIKADIIKKAIFPQLTALTDNSVAALFLETVADNPDEAWAFVSRHYAASLDLEALRDVLGPNHVCPCLINAPYEDQKPHHRVRSVLVMDSNKKIKRLLHLHMVKEPDKYGQWKIFGVEQE